MAEAKTKTKVKKTTAAKRKPVKRKPLDKDEMRVIAENIARDPESYPSARISSLRFLRELDDANPEKVKDDFSKLDEVAAQRRKAATG